MLLVAAIALALSSSCTALYFFNSSEEGLACGPDDGNARCSEGFVCVDVAGDESCVKAGFKQEGEACVANGECADEGVCADVFAGRCGDDQEPEHVLDCALRNVADGGLRCRRPCNADFTCGEGLRCFDLGVDEIPPFCQEGTCATDGDCFSNSVRGFCVEEGLNGGRSGLCRVQCDPLACFDGGNDCDCVDGQACASPPDDGAVSSRAICTVPGTFGQNIGCDVINGCLTGFTCAPIQQTGNVCLQWCDATGVGPPACNEGVCQGVDGAVGICR
ncbi:MAG: hypothetical protein Q8O67_08270 [Deltaproteobacteria bacterium]|nr:hypothetical protein [Deltaproteobacteria bacterium]